MGVNGARGQLRGAYGSPLCEKLREQPQYVTTSHNRCLKSEPQITLDARAQARCVRFVSLARHRPEQRLEGVGLRTSRG